MSQRSKQSFSLGLITVLIALGFLTLRSLAANDLDGATDPPNDPPAVTLPQELEVLMLRARLDPEALAAVGVTGAGLSTQLAEAEDDLVTALGALDLADSDYAAARVERDRLQRLVRSGQGTGEDVAALVVAKAGLADAEAARGTALDSAFTAATSGLTEDQRATLSQIRANAKWKWCPVQYRVLDQSEANWMALRDALSGIHTHERIGEDAPQECLDHIATCDADEDVAAAITSCGAHLASLQATWDATFVD